MSDTKIRALREGPETRLELDRVQLETQGKQIAALITDQGKIFALLRRIAAKLDVPDEEPIPDA